MNDENLPGNHDPLAKAQAIIAQQAAEIQRLRRQLDERGLAEELRDAFILAGLAGTVTSPVTHARLLEMIVETAMHVISARAGALFLIDEATQELVFEVALGPRGEEAKKFRIPLGHGVAGLVAVSGQPMAISDAQQDPRHAADVSQSVGYLPQSILCVPLFYGDQIIGVLELLDKEGESSFGSTDMTILGMFAQQAAVAIEQSRTHQSLIGLIRAAVESLGTAGPGGHHNLAARAAALGGRVEADADYRQALELALLVQEIARWGERERQVCRTILNGLAEYLNHRSIDEMGMAL